MSLLSLGDALAYRADFCIVAYIHATLGSEDAQKMPLGMVWTLIVIPRQDSGKFLLNLVLPPF